MARNREQQPQSFRDYTFRAGRLEGKRLRNISDGQLDWALEWNMEYIRTLQDPRSTVRHQGRRTTVGALPPGEAQRKIALAEEALAACRKERAYREEQRAMEAAVEGQRKAAEAQNAPAPVAHTAAGVLEGAVNANELTMAAQEFTDAAEQLADLAGTLADIAQALDQRAKRLRSILKQRERR